MIEPLPDVSKVFSSILQQERQISSSSFFDNSNILLAQFQHMTPNRFNPKHNKGRGKPSSYTKSPSNSKMCSFCGKTCHIVDTCYFNHGFPPGFRFKDKVGFTNNAATAYEHQESSSPDATPQEDKVEISSTMYNKLVALLNQVDTSTPYDSHAINTSSSGTTFAEDDWAC
ncbi:hypothetical protein KIW84_073224 [Lathyrus oleraceus]|uniref:Uncharacterized protein n=1 Tax=Pisum sativum TaxID=3888 RepID=A0A9D4ZYB4_PEA|nr:hypothetical protein KIW84_073224 [Pisum sativum]